MAAETALAYVDLNADVGGRDHQVLGPLEGDGAAGLILRHAVE